MPMPFCGPHGEPILGDAEVPYTSRGKFIGLFYLIVYFLLGFPQILCLYALCHKKHLQYSCYKLMLMVSVLDLFNLTEGALICGIFSIFDLSHCNFGRPVLAFGEMIMIMWFVYCATSVVLALNRVLEFVSRPACKFLFDGKRAWLWAIPAWTYGLTMGLSIPQPFYYYVPEKGELTFYRISKDQTKLLDNQHHIVNNTIKGLAIACSYVVMLVAMRYKLKTTGVSMSKLEVMLSIQAFFVGSMSVLSSVVYVLLGYLPVGNFSLIGPIGMLCWLSTHGGSAYVYLIMNRSIRHTAFKLFNLESSMLFKIKKATVANAVAPYIVNHTSSSPNVRICARY